MTVAPTNPGILLVDDGELDDVAAVLDDQNIAYKRLRGGQIPAEVPPPRDLLIVTPRRVERVRRGSPADANPGRPLRIIAVAEDSPAMRRRLRRNGLHLLIRLPASAEIWRLLVARALYQGSERRTDPRVPVGAPVEMAKGSKTTETVLLDLSNRGCRIQTSAALTVGDPIEFTIPADGEVWSEQGPLTLSGHVRRLVCEPGDDRSMLAVVFDPNLEESLRTRLTTLINHWASGPYSIESAIVSGAPPLPACKIDSLPDLTLDDETDPPILASGGVCLELSEGSGATRPEAGDGRERRTQSRGQYVSSIVAEGAQGPFVLIGRDLSPGGMRIEHHPDLAVGDHFEIALHGPTPGNPIRVLAEIVRDDGPGGFGVIFDHLDRESAAQLEKTVACLPDVESLEDGELGGLGAILSEIVSKN